MGEVGDPNVTASIAIDDVLFDNKTCEEFPQGKLNFNFFISSRYIHGQK